jgi:hypothetical protein
VCPTSGRCSADGERQSKQGGRKTEGESRELIARQALAQTLSRMPGAIAHPRTDVRLRLPVRRNEVASGNAESPLGGKGTLRWHSRVQSAERCPWPAGSSSLKLVANAVSRGYSRGGRTKGNTLGPIMALEQQSSAPDADLRKRGQTV